MLLGHIGDNNSVFEAAFWFDESWPEVFYAPEYGKWYRSKQKKDWQSPFASYMLNKKWTLEEEFNNHMMRFNQVTVTSIFLHLTLYILTFQAGLTVIEVHFKEEKEADDPEPLRMEHFYFPLGMWLVGIFLSVFCFAGEIIIHRLSKTDVPVARLEEPDVSQSTPGSETSQRSDNLEEMALPI